MDIDCLRLESWETERERDDLLTYGFIMQLQFELCEETVELTNPSIIPKHPSRPRLENSTSVY
jgi:hypothetical protein